jgi:tetratricopeptide (TPR) repeat protein
LSQTTTELERYFGATAANEWDLLLGHLEFSSGFAFIVLLVPDNTAGEVCERDLERVLESQGKFLERAPTGSPNALQDLPQWLLNRDSHDDVSAIWVKAIITEPLGGATAEAQAKFARWEHAWKESISRLNERRDTLKSRYACPVIFVGAPWLKVLLREYAPDLWSVRKLVIELQPEARFTTDFSGLPTLNFNTVGETITDGDNNNSEAITDPDFAMKRLHEASNKKQQLDLLNRAYEGFKSQGRYSDALNTIEQSLKLDLESNERARQLNRFGIVLSNLGQHKDAYTATQESVNLFRDLARDDPQAFNPDLANSLNNLSSRFRRLGQHEEALTVAQEAVNMLRKLVQVNPQAFIPDLATSLNSLGLRFGNLERREEALAATQEAAMIRRDLARDNPQAFIPVLADSLNNLGIYLNALGRHEEALAATQEAISIRRDPAKENPLAINPNLANSLNNFGIYLSNAGRREEALAAFQEALSIRRDLVRDNPQAFNPDLADDLNSLGFWFASNQRVQEAQQHYEAAIRTLAPFFLDLPAAHAQQMRYMVRDYIQSCQTLNLEPDLELIQPIQQKLEELGTQTTP